MAAGGAVGGYVLYRGRLRFCDDHCNVAGDVSGPCAASVQVRVVTGRRLRNSAEICWAVVLSVLFVGCYSNSGDSV